MLSSSGKTPRLKVEDFTNATGPTVMLVTRPDGAADRIAVQDGVEVLRATGDALLKPWAKLTKDEPRRQP